MSSNTWSKRNRLAVAITIYENLYWDYHNLDKKNWVFDVDYLQEFLSGEKTDEISGKIVKNALEDYHEKKKKMDLVLKDYIEDISKTFLIVNAVLYAFLVERDLVEEVSEKEKLVGKYIKLTQDLIAGGNTSLVHAILSKIQPSSDKNIDTHLQQNQEKNEEKPNNN